MKKFIFVLVALVMLTTAPAFAHCGKCGIGDEKGHEKGGMKGEMTDASKGEMADKRIKKLTKQLDLSPEQAKQVEALMDTKMEKKKAIHEEVEKKMEAIREEYKAGLKSILTPEQLVKYESLKDEKGNMRKHHKSSRKDKE